MTYRAKGQGRVAPLQALEPIGTQLRPFDVLIVGSGAAGCWAAKQLTEGGLEVCLMEVGPALEGTRPIANVTPSQRLLAGRFRSSFSGRPVQSKCSSFVPFFNDHLYVNDRENPYIVDRGSPFVWIRGRQLGGRLQTWSRAALRMSDGELRPGQQRTLPNMSWPVSYSDLEPHYSTVERTLGVYGECDGVGCVPDGEFIAPPPLSPRHHIFSQAITAHTKLRVLKNRVVVFNRNLEPLPLQLARQTGRLTLRTRAAVSKVLLDSQERIAVGVEYVDCEQGRSQAVYGRIVLLCASAFESVRILLNSATSMHRQGLANSSGLLGHYITDHVSFAAGGPITKTYRPAEEHFAAESADPPRDPWDNGAYCLYLPNFCGEWGSHPTFSGGYGIQCGVERDRWWALAFGEMIPTYEGHITLASQTKDAWGIPVAHIRIRHNENERRMVEHMRTSIGAITRALGLKVRADNAQVHGVFDRILFWSLRGLFLHRNGAFLPGLSIHEAGGARMGTSPDSSVLTPYCQSWDVPNLFVTDAACFPTTGFQNPTLTIMAITVRACEYLLSHFEQLASSVSGARAVATRREGFPPSPEEDTARGTCSVAT